MSYRFKRGSDKIIKSKVPSSTLVQSIFWSRIMLKIYQSKFIVNIDESSFNRSVRSHYSWLPKGSSHSILNTFWTGRTTVIFGLWTNGKWLAMTLDGTTNSESFILYLLILTNFVKISFKNIEFPIIWVLDNAAVHTTENTKISSKAFGNRAQLASTILTAFSYGGKNLWVDQKENLKRRGRTSSKF